MFRGHVDIVPESDFIRFQISQGFLNLTLRLVTPDTPTHVVFEPAGWRTDVNVTIAGQNSRPIGPGTHESPITLGFDTGPANPSSSGYFHLAATAFIDSDNKQRELLVFRMV